MTIESAAGPRTEGAPAEAAAEPPLTGRLYGLLADFDSPWALLDAARRVHAEGYREVDASPLARIDPPLLTKTDPPGGVTG